MADLMTTHPQMAAFGADPATLQALTCEPEGLTVMAKVAEHPEVAAKVGELLASPKGLKIVDLLRFLPFVIALLRGQEIDWAALLDLLNELLNPPTPGAAPANP